MPELITEQDKYTVEELDRGLRVCKSKLGREDLSDSIKRKVKRLNDKYTTQKAKTLRLYERKKKKSPSLKSLDVTSLSVKRILEIAAKDKGKTANLKEIGPVANFFLANGAENSIAIAAAGMALTGFLGSPNGQAMLKEAGTAIKDWAAKTFLDANGLNFSAIAFTGGVAIFAGVMIKKAIRKSMQATAIERHEVESAMNKGTAHDLNNLASNKAALIDQASAGKEMDNETFKYLVQVATNPENKPSVIAAANDILNEARKRRAAAKTQVENSLISAYINDDKTVVRDTNDLLPNPSRSSEHDIVTIKEAMLAKLKYKEIKDLAAVGTSLSREKDIRKTLGLSLTGTVTYSAEQTKLKNAATDPTILDKINSNRVKDVKELETVLGITTSLSGKDADLAKQIIAKAQAIQTLKNKEAAGEYELSSGVIKIPVATTNNGLQMFNEDEIGHYRNAALLTAAERAGLKVGKGTAGTLDEREHDARQFEIKHAAQIVETEKAMMEELEAARTGMIK